MINFQYQFEILIFFMSLLVSPTQQINNIIPQSITWLQTELSLSLSLNTNIKFGGLFQLFFTMVISNFAYQKNYNIKLINENYSNKKKAHLNFLS